MTSFGASAGAPIANPPGGNISPTFTNLTTATDVIVGKNLRVGDSIVPNSGKSFALAADKVNFTKDIEAKGNIVSDGGNITATGGGSLNGWNVKATSTVMGTNADFSQNIKALGTVTGKDVVADGGNISATGGGAISGWNLKATSTVSGTNASFSQDINAAGKITGKDIVASGTLSTNGHIKAASIGDFVFGSDKPIAVTKNGGVTSTTKYCPDNTSTILSCALRYFGPGGNPMPTPNIYNGKAHIGNSSIDRFSDPSGIPFCNATVWNQYDVAITYQIQTTCFNSNK